jgi:hypothetical protein
MVYSMAERKYGESWQIDDNPLIRHHDGQLAVDHEIRSNGWNQGMFWMKIEGIKFIRRLGI